MAYKSSNPALNKKTFDNLPQIATTGVMTLEGVARKSLLLLVLAVGSGAVTWQLAARNDTVALGLMFVSMIAALIVAVVTVVKKQWSPVTAPLYALLEGVVLGSISYVYEQAYGGLVLQAILMTLGIFVTMLLLYMFKIIRATENFKLGVAAATGGIFIYYMINLVLGFFGKDMPLINSTSIWGILFSAAVVILAALNLVVDFDFVETGVEKKAPKYMEFYASFGLLVTVVWLYLEILRLLAKSRER